MEKQHEKILNDLKKYFDKKNENNNKNLKKNKSIDNNKKDKKKDNKNEIKKEDNKGDNKNKIEENNNKIKGHSKKKLIKVKKEYKEDNINSIKEISKDKVDKSKNNLMGIINELKTLNNKIKHDKIEIKKFEDISSKLNKNSNLDNNDIKEINNLIDNLEESYKSNLNRLSRAEKRALGGKTQSKFLNDGKGHPTDLRNDKEFNYGNIYVIKTPFQHVFMVCNETGRWMFDTHKNAYNYSKYNYGKYNYRYNKRDEKLISKPVSYNAIGKKLDELDNNTKVEVYQKIKEYVIKGKMPWYRDISNLYNYWWEPKVYYKEGMNEEQCAYAGCLSAAWLLSESGPGRVRVRGKIERALLRPLFEKYNYSFSNLIKALPQSITDGVKGTNYAIHNEVDGYAEGMIAKQKAEQAIKAIPTGDISGSSDEEESNEFKGKIEEIRKKLNEYIN